MLPQTTSRVTQMEKQEKQNNNFLHTSKVCKECGKILCERIVSGKKLCCSCHDILYWKIGDKILDKCISCKELAIINNTPVVKEKEEAFKKWLSGDPNLQKEASEYYANVMLKEREIRKKFFLKEE